MVDMAVHRAVLVLLLSCVVQVSGVALRGRANVEDGKRPLWTFWDSSSQPDFLSLCLKALEQHAGNGWKLHVLSRESARSYVDDADLPEAFDSLQPSFQADALRLALLRRRGGAWIDATAIVTRDFSKWIDAEFDAGQQFVGFFIDHYTNPSGPPLIASWALAVPQAEQPVMVAWHNAYLKLWNQGHRKSADDITSDPFFSHADLSHVDPFMRDYLHVELVLLALMQSDASLRDEFLEHSSITRAEDTAYSLQASLGLHWMATQKCDPVTVDVATMPSQVGQALDATPLVKFRHEDRKWLMKMSASQLLSNPHSVVGSIFARANLNASSFASTSAGDSSSQAASLTCSNDDSNDR